MREREILDLVDRGLSNKEIAERLSIELSTVKNHVHNVLDKLQVRRRSDAVAFVRRREASTIHAVVERN
jgi:DNA-binding NarL/FixJ family response regulator